MGSARVALDGGYIAGKVAGVFGSVGFTARASGFFVHPGDYAEGASRTQVKALENFGGLNGHDYAVAGVDRSGSQLPGIEMAGVYYDLLGMLGTSEVGDYVVAGFVGKFLGSQSEMHADLPFSGEMDDQVSIFGGDGRGGDSGWEVESSVREAIIGVAYGADQGGYCAQIGGGFGASSAIADCLAVSSES